jgi:peptidoglycan/xylan/chitin deacetylase (PgdA/CDA1 family)
MMLGKLTRNVRRTVSKLKNQVSPGAIILMYHRVAEVDSDPWSLCVTPKHFAEHLEVLQDYGHPRHLQDLTQRLRDRQSIHRSVVITFDDGYADNLHNAKPLLEQYAIPATVFVTTRGIGQVREFWWDELDRLLLQPRILPNELQLTIQGEVHQWNLAAVTPDREANSSQYRTWRMEQAEDPTPRHSLYRALYQHLQALSIDERTQVLDELCRWANAKPVGRPTHRSLTQDELLELAEGGLIEIGSHTVTHPFLAHQTVATQQHEIQQSKDDLEAILGHPISSFSYPNGSHTAETAALVQASGFSCACSSIANKIQPQSHHFRLPRVVVDDWDGETFANWLSTYF